MSHQNSWTHFTENQMPFCMRLRFWNSCAVKQKMREFVSSGLRRFGKNNAEAFCFGDGLGFDSTDLSRQGHRVRYFEPSLRCQEFARRVFEDNGVEVAHLKSLEAIEPQSLDAVVCLDVLEHVPQPQSLVRKFHEWLKPDGLLFVHAPFWCIHWTRSTHLKENQYLSGDLSRMYNANGFSAVDASVFWDPILLQKSDHNQGFKVSAAAAMRIRLGQLLLTLGRRDGTVHTWIARRIARAPKQWIQSLQTHNPAD